ncbi:MAG TPA: GTPase [Marinagarivorans sp.]
MKHYFDKLTETLLAGEAENAAPPTLPEVVPVLWLLGKTGAGKTSLVRNLTLLDEAVVGNGFEPCTRTAREFEFPQGEPLLRFLDTRGLGEVGYDPSDDIAHCQQTSHIALIVARLDDPVQLDVADTIKRLRRQSPKTPIIVVHTGADLLNEGERQRARTANHALFEQAAGQALRSAAIAMPLHNNYTADVASTDGIDNLVELIADTLPEVALLLAQERANDQETKAFKAHRAIALRYASAAATADLAPVVGALAVPSTQAAMLQKLATGYGVPWSKKRLGEFTAALGVAMLTRFGGSYLSRQLAKLIPAYGQTLGAMTASAISFATTYALARTAGYYLFQIKHGHRVNPQALRALYKSSLTNAAETLRKSKK